MWLVDLNDYTFMVIYKRLILGLNYEGIDIAQKYIFI